jgi:hypothetical protein
MEWNKLWTDFENGKPDAIQAIFSVLTTIITALGAFYVAITFREQRKINREQQNLNRLAAEKDRRELFPWFTGEMKSQAVVDNVNIIKYGLMLRDNKALEVEIFPITKSGKIKKAIYQPCQVVLPKDNETFVDLDIKEVGFQPNSGYEKQYLIYFLDQVGRPYTQDLGHNGQKVVLLYPQTVSYDFRKKLKIE